MCLSCFSGKEPANRANDGQLGVGSNRSTQRGGNSERIRGSPEYLTPKLVQTDRSHRGNPKVPGYEEQEKVKRVNEANIQKRNSFQRDHLVISISSSSNEEEKCVILNPNINLPRDVDFEHKLPLSYYDPSRPRDEDVTVISERGEVASRDYPHSRHNCGKFPFNVTTHERCCPQCYCYVCDLVAPCKYWNGISGHCHASDEDPKWEEMRMLYREYVKAN